MKMSAVIPAHDEAKTIASVVEALSDDARIGEIIVVANACTDDTSARAQTAGARVVECGEIGFGRAIKAGVAAASHTRILKTDGDITNWRREWIDLFDSSDSDLVRGVFESPYDEFPVTNLAVRPLLNLFRPEWSTIPRLLTGQYVFERTAFDWADFPDDWSFDLCVLVWALENQLSITDVDLGLLDDTHRSIQYYIPMATDLQRFLLMRFGLY